MKNIHFVHNVNCGFELGIPIFYDVESIKKLNEYLKKNNIKILLKLHPAQDSSKIKQLNMSNFDIINDEYLNSYDINLYELLACSDSLITDYSSVYYDYLLLKKVIGLTIDDIEIYSNKIGFVDDYYKLVDGEFIKNIDDFYLYLNKIINPSKSDIEKYSKIFKKYHKYDDNKSAERLFQFIDDILENKSGISN